MKWKRIALNLCQAKIDTPGFCLEKLGVSCLHFRKHILFFNLNASNDRILTIGRTVIWFIRLYVKKAEHQRFDAFELWCWRRLLRVPWTARRFNQSIPKEMSPEYSLETLMLKLKLQYFGHLMWRADSLEKTLMLGKTGKAMTPNSSTLAWRIPGMGEPGELLIYGVTQSRT